MGIILLLITQFDIWKKDGDIQRDPNGKIIFTPISNPSHLKTYNFNDTYSKFLSNGASFVHAQVQQGYIWTDEGNPILVYKIISVIVPEQISDGKGGVRTIQHSYNIDNSNVSFYQTNCFGRSVADGQFFIPEIERSRGGIQTALQDEYKEIKGKNGGYIAGDIVDIGQKEKETGKYNFGSHVVKASGQVNSKGEMLFDSQFAYDEEGLKLMTLKEIVQYANKNIIDPEEEGEFSAKNIKVYRRTLPEVRVPMVVIGPYKSAEGQATEKKLTNDEDVQSEQAAPPVDVQH
ncbi:MAG: hypothetical protein V4556_00095 [Bacteroidota bacterium]